jgi:galactokinase
MIKVSAPARICFFGDHQDYLNLPVIAGTINRYIQIEAEPSKENSFFIQLIDIDKVKTIDLNKKYNKIDNGDYFLSVLEVLKKAGFLFNQGYKIKLSGDIPINAGISSSSALVVAWIRFLLEIQDQKKEINDVQIGKWAYESESSFFNQPGGIMDQYTIAQKGLLYINTQTTRTERLNPNIGCLVIAESGLAKRTLGVLQKARSYSQSAIAAVLDKVPQFEIHSANESEYEEYLHFVPEIYRDHWYAAIFNHLLTQKARKMLISGSLDIEQLGNLMNAHQKILQQRIQNTPEIMQKQMQAACNAGALGAKIIGSGGGGCMVAMVTENTKEKVIQAFLNKGAKTAYEISLSSPI